ncbi:MAG: glycosyltransferase family 4 protein [Lentisphaeria bacterium]
MKKLNILHLYSDWKWTGPAEPAIQMCLALQKLGHNVIFACRATPPEHALCEETVEMKAAEYGIKYTTEFGLNRYWGLKDSFNDLLKLPAYLRKHKIDVVHTHLSHDHAFGSYAVKVSMMRKKPVLVKSMHNRAVLAPKFLNNCLLKGLKKRNGLVVFTEGFKEKYSKKFGIPMENIGICPMPLDLNRFNREINYLNQREKYNVPESSPLIGIVARFQKYRRMDVFMQAARKVADEFPNVRFMVIGRSGQMEETVLKPMRELGLEQNVITPGYLIDNYVDMMMTLDVFTLMTPGFDGTARAMREAMALGKPCVVSNIGMLPEIVEDGKSGYVFEFTDANSLAEAWLKLLRDKDKAKALGDYGAEYALENFKLENVGPALNKFYNSLLQK